MDGDVIFFFFFILRDLICVYEKIFGKRYQEIIERSRRIQGFACRRIWIYFSLREIVVNYKINLEKYNTSIDNRKNKKFVILTSL